MRSIRRWALFSVFVILPAGATGEGGKSPEFRPRNLKIFKPTGKEFSPDPKFVALLAEVKSETLMTWVRALSNIENRSSRAAGIQEATTYLEAQFQSLGYSPKRQCFNRTQFGDVCNVGVFHPAATPTKDNVVVMAHFDSVGYPKAGADDNASGTAGLLEIARILRNRRTQTNVTFVAVNAEEVGLVGSKYYVKQLMAEGELGHVKLAVIMDMEGYNVRGTVDVETYEAHRALGQAFINEIPAYVGLQSRLIIPGWGSDHVSFLEKGVPAFLLINDTDVKTPCYHKACDKPETIDVPYFTKMIQANLLATAKAAVVD